jgi:signal transduction histidine kinase
LALTADVAAGKLGSGTDVAAGEPGSGAGVTAVGDDLDHIRDLARTARRELRAVVDDLRPADLARDGLTVTLGKHLDMVGRACQVKIMTHLDGLDVLPDETQRALLRITQEAVHNAVRHGRPSRIEVRAGREGAGFTLRIRDDGHGFDPLADTGSGRKMGLVSMRDRAATVGGRLELQSARGHGTEVVVRIAGG